MNDDDYMKMVTIINMMTKMTLPGGTRHEAAGGRPDDQAEREAGQAGQVAQRALQVQVGLSLATRFFDNSFLWQLVSLAPFFFGNLSLCENTVFLFNREGTAEDRVILDCVTSLQHGEDLSLDFDKNGDIEMVSRYNVVLNCVNSLQHGEDLSLL